MATYKVLQDIEAEDKLVWIFSLRQCIYAAIAIINGWLAFLVITKGAPVVAVIFLPFIAMGVFFAIPWSKQQSTEVWALAKIRFALKPRRRIWDQTGAKDLVTVTAPKRHEGPAARNLSETEVRSRLQALADTIDSRGWAVKNVNVNLGAQPYVFEASADRLVDANNMPQEVSDVSTTASDDIFDLANNPIAQQFEQKITAASAAHRQQVMEVVNNPAMAAAANAGAGVGQNYWYMSSPTTTQAPAPVTSTPAAPATSWSVPQAAVPTPEEEALAEEIRRKQELFDASLQNGSHLKVIQPLSAQQAQTAQPVQASQVPSLVQAPVSQSQPAVTDMTTAQQPVTAAPNPAILELATNNDLDVATIAREAQHRNADAAGEVVVKLH